MKTKFIVEAIMQCQKMANHLDHDENWNLALAAKEELTTIQDATWNAALEAAVKALLDSGLQGNTASKHEVAGRILSLKRGQS